MGETGKFSSCSQGAFQPVAISERERLLWPLLKKHNWCHYWMIMIEFIAAHLSRSLSVAALW